MLSIKTHAFIRVPFYKQRTNFSCGPVSVRMILEFFENDRAFSEKDLIQYLKANADTGTENFRLMNFLLGYGYKVFNTKKASLEDLLFLVGQWVPVIVNYRELTWDIGHFAVVIGFTPVSIILNEPWIGELFKITKSDFIKRWVSEDGVNEQWMLAAIKEQYFPYYMLGKYEKEFIWKMS